MQHKRLALEFIEKIRSHGSNARHYQLSKHVNRNSAELLSNHHAHIETDIIPQSFPKGFLA